jgi:hypothetical protein
MQMPGRSDEETPMQGSPPAVHAAASLTAERLLENATFHRTEVFDSAKESHIIRGYD